MTRISIFSVVLFLMLFACSNEEEMNADETYSNLKSIEGDYHLDMDEGNFFSWENQDSLIVGTAYSTSDKDTILSELHSIELASDSILYQVTVFNNDIPLTINYALQDATDQQFTFGTDEREFPKQLTFEIADEELMITRDGILVGTEQSFTETYLRR